MKRLTRDEVRAERLLRAARSIAVLGASAGRGRGGSAIVEYLKQEGFDVFPVREDRADVAGLASWGSLGDVSGPLDIVLVLNGGVDQKTIAEAARKGARALWLQPGVAVGDAERLAAAQGLPFIAGHDIVVEQRHTEQVAGQPRKRGVSAGRRKPLIEDDRKRRDETGWVADGGGGQKGGGGKRAVVDEKKMLGGKPSPRRGRLRPAR